MKKNSNTIPTIIPTTVPTPTTTPPENRSPSITTRDQQAILGSLVAGLVPQTGLHHLAVGREKEIKALCHDLDIIAQEGAAFRIVTGPNGAGKTFLQHLIRSEAINAGLVVLSADLGVNHRFFGSEGRGRALYSGLLANVFTKACPSGNGLRPLLETSISKLALEQDQAAGSAGAVAAKIHEWLSPLRDFPGGFEFATVLARYYEGHLNDNPALQDNAVRWLRAEYSTKTEARQDLGVRRIIDDEEIYPALKLFAGFCRLSGYRGVLVLLDELSALTHRLPNVRARQANVTVLLSIVNDCLQGGASGLGFVLAGTPDSLEDRDRGLFSIPALRSRLQGYAPTGYTDYASPVLRLEPLGKDELLVLIHKVRRVKCLGDESKQLLPDDALDRFLNRALSRFGRTVLSNPRDVLRPFVTVLNLLEQQPDQNWEELIDRVMVEPTAADRGASQLENLKLR